MKLKRRRGATLGLVAVCVLAIIVLGIGFFILSQILGGGREIANATDAGVLTVARHALDGRNVNVELPPDQMNTFFSDFVAFDPSVRGVGISGGNIDMLSINRVIAQAVIVALNARDLETPEAATNAQSVARAAQMVSRNLRTLLNDNGYLRDQFTGVAQSNNTKMFQGNRAEIDGALVSGFMRPGLSTNVHFPQVLRNTFAQNPPSDLLNDRERALRNSATSPYMAGYVNFDIPLAQGRVQIAGIPVFPQQRPHLVDLGEFNAASANDPVNSDYLPPNAFRANTTTLENNTGGFGAAVACALVGALDQDFQAAIPRGFIAFKNGPEVPQPAINATPVVDGTHDVFNNELWGPNGGIQVANNGVFAINNGGDGQRLIADWRNYNNSNDPDAQRPPLPSESPGSYRANPPSNTGGLYVSVPGGYRHVNDLDVRGIRSIAHCKHDNYFPEDRNGSSVCFPNDSNSGDPRSYLGGSVGDTFTALSALTGANNDGGSTTATTNYTAVEFQKAELLRKRAAGARCASVGPAPTTGMKKFNPHGCYKGSPANPFFGVAGSPLDYLQQIDRAGGVNCEGRVFNMIVNRMQQVDSSVTPNKVRLALGSQQMLPGDNLFLFSPGGGEVELARATSGSYFNASIPADGANSHMAIRGAAGNCRSTYTTAFKMVNAAAGNGVSGASCGSTGDMNYHYAPFVQGPGNGLRAHDSVHFSPASGWRNLLGECRFTNEAGDAGTFCKPN